MFTFMAFRGKFFRGYDIPWWYWIVCPIFDAELLLALLIMFWLFGGKIN